MSAHTHSTACGCDHLSDKNLEDLRRQEEDYWDSLREEDDDYLFDEEPLSFDNGPSLDDVEIDHCTGCGRAFGWTEALREAWIQKCNPGPNEMQPQHCWRCINLETNEDEGYE